MEPKQQPKSSFVNALAMISIAVAVYMFISDVVGIVAYNSLTNSPSYGWAQRQLQSMSDSGSLFFSSKWIIASSIVSVILSGATIVASVGLFRRKNWGRVSYIGLLWIQSVYYIATAIGGYYLAQHFIEQSGLNQYAALSSMMMLGGSTAFVGGFIALAITVFFTWKLSTYPVRQEFM